MKYYLLPLGCQMNLSDTERVRTVLNGMGFVQTENEDEATILGIIACSVRQKGIDKVYGRIEKWNAMKNRQNVITFVSGCILPADRLRFLKLFDLVFAMNELPNLPEMIRQYGIVTPASLRYGEEIEYQPVVKPLAPLFHKDDNRPIWISFGPSRLRRHPVSRPSSQSRTAATNSAPTVPCPTPVAARCRVPRKRF